MMLANVREHSDGKGQVVSRTAPPVIAMNSISRIGLLLCLGSLFGSVENKGQYTESLNSGLQFSLPYGAANIFIKPNGVITTTFLAFAMCFILFFGVITSPFGYVFGIPSRKYVLGSESEIEHAQTAGIKRSLDESDGLDPALLHLINSYSKYDVRNAMHYLMPEEGEEDCNSLMICYAHGILKKLPTSAIRFYQFFSRRILNADEDMKIAVKAGLKGYKNCDLMYSKCPYGPFKLLLRSLRRILPASWGKRVTREEAQS